MIELEVPSFKRGEHTEVLISRITKEQKAFLKKHRIKQSDLVRSAINQLMEKEKR